MAQCRRKYKSICMSFKDKATYAKDISDYVVKVGIDKAKELVQTLLDELRLGENDYQFNYSEAA